MMTSRVDPDERDFEAVARAFLEERAERRGNSLRRFLQRYPEYEKELVLLAAETAASDGEIAIPATPPSHLLQRLRDEARATLTPGASAELQSLRDQAKQQAGLTLPALAEDLGIGIDVLALLEERQIVPNTIRPGFIDRLAMVLRAPRSAVEALLRRPSSPAMPSVAYYAPQGHLEPESLTFDEAVSASQLMTDEQKAFWLEEGPASYAGQ